MFKIIFFKIDVFMLDLGTIHKVCAIKFDTFGPPPPSVVCFLYWGNDYFDKIV